MRRFLMVLLLMLIALVNQTAFAQNNQQPTISAQGITTPPAINMPAGGIMVTEVNISDADVLGIIKQAVPAFVNTLSTSLGNAPLMSKEAQDLAILKSLDFNELIDAIKGITNIRLLVVAYGQRYDPPVFLGMFDHGARKLSGFNKIASDFAFAPGTFALYAQAENKGYMGVLYDPESGVAYALRIVGSVDVVKLSQWAANAIGTIVKNEAGTQKASNVAAPQKHTVNMPATDV